MKTNDVNYKNATAGNINYFNSESSSIHDSFPDIMRNSVIVTYKNLTNQSKLIVCPIKTEKPIWVECLD